MTAAASLDGVAVALELGKISFESGPEPLATSTRDRLGMWLGELGCATSSRTITVVEDSTDSLAGDAVANSLISEAGAGGEVGGEFAGSTTSGAFCSLAGDSGSGFALVAACSLASDCSGLLDDTWLVVLGSAGCAVVRLGVTELGSCDGGGGGGTLEELGRAPASGSASEEAAKVVVVTASEGAGDADASLVVAGVLVVVVAVGGASEAACVTRSSGWFLAGSVAIVLGAASDSAIGGELVRVESSAVVSGVAASRVRLTASGLAGADVVGLISIGWLLSLATGEISFSALVSLELASG